MPFDSMRRNLPTFFPRLLHQPVGEAGRPALLEVELSLVLKPVLQSLRAMAADTLGVVGTATVEVDCPKLFRERLKDVFSPRQSFQFAEDGSR